MRAFVVTGPGLAGVCDVEPPAAGPGQVVVDVERVGVCGTDVEFFTGAMAYLHTGHAAYPMRLGHEWCGTVGSVGDGVDGSWLRRRVMGDTMLGCGHCPRCRSGRQHVCADRFEVGIRHGWPGALAEQVLLPATALHALPDSVDAVAGALVEPGGSALRAVEAVAVGAGSRLLIFGPGAIGLLCARFALARDVEVHLVGETRASLDFARTLGVHGAWLRDQLPSLSWDGVIDATTGAGVPAAAVDLVEPGRRVAYVGLAGEPSLLDSRALVLGDVTAVGILSASPGLAATIDHYARGLVDPRPIVAATVGLDQVAEVLAGWRPPGSGPGPKIQVDPCR